MLLEGRPGSRVLAVDPSGYVMDPGKKNASEDHASSDRPLKLKPDMHSELQHTLVQAVPPRALSACDRSIASQIGDGAVTVQQHIRDVGSRVTEMGRVRSVKCVEAELCDESLGDLKITETR